MNKAINNARLTIRKPFRKLYLHTLQYLGKKAFRFYTSSALDALIGGKVSETLTYEYCVTKAHIWDGILSACEEELKELDA